MTDSVLSLIPTGGYTGWDSMGLGYDSSTPIQLQGAYTSAGNVLFSLQNTAVGGDISKITLRPYLVCYTPGGGSQTILGKVKLSGTTYTVGSIDISYSATPTLKSINVTENPATEDAWTWSDIDALMAGVYKAYYYAGWATLYRFSVAVSYAPGTYTSADEIIGGVGIAPGGMVM
jgi:hypothetical protein